MSDNQEKTGFAAMDGKAADIERSHDEENFTQAPVEAQPEADPNEAQKQTPAEVTEANSQAKNEGDVIKDDTLGLDSSNIPENLQTTSAHRNDAANANTINEVKTGHDAAIAEIRDSVAEFKANVEAEFIKLRNEFADLTKSADALTGDSELSLALHHRFVQIERAVGIHVEEPSDESAS